MVLAADHRYRVFHQECLLNPRFSAGIDAGEYGVELPITQCGEQCVGVSAGDFQGNARILPQQRHAGEWQNMLRDNHAGADAQMPGPASGKLVDLSLDVEIGGACPLSMFGKVLSIGGQVDAFGGAFQQRDHKLAFQTGDAFCKCWLGKPDTFCGASDVSSGCDFQKVGQIPEFHGGVSFELLRHNFKEWI